MRSKTLGSAVLAGVLVFGAAACGSDDEPSNDGGTDTTVTTEAGSTDTTEAGSTDTTDTTEAGSTDTTEAGSTDTTEATE